MIIQTAVYCHANMLMFEIHTAEKFYTEEQSINSDICSYP